jgi:hypothetical protein
MKHHCPCVTCAEIAVQPDLVYGTCAMDGHTVPGPDWGDETAVLPAKEKP